VSRYYDPSEKTFSFIGGAVVKLKSDNLKMRIAPYFKFGLNYFSSSTVFVVNNSANFSRKTNNFYFNSNSSVSRDSVASKELFLLYSTENINAEANFLFGLGVNSFYFYAGAGGFIGTNFSGTSKIKYNQLDSVSDYTSNNEQIYYHTIRNTKEQTLSNSPGFSFGAIITGGVDFQLIGPISLFAEFRLLYRSNIISNYRQFGTTIQQSNFGLKYKLPERR
jgi:hypothetical protein